MCIFQSVMTVIFSSNVQFIVNNLQQSVILFIICLTFKKLCSMPAQFVYIFRMRFTVIGCNFAKQR